MFEQIVVVTIFAVALAIIASEKINRSIVSLIGASILVIFGFIDQHHAIQAIDFNTLGLLIGMMILVSISAKTGFYEYLAISVIHATKGRPIYILLALALLTAVLSAFLDNVTTILLVSPISLFVAQILRTSPVPFIISQIMFSNIGGTATLVGDPPNIIIGSAAGLSYMDFIVNIAPAVGIILLISLLVIYFYFRNQIPKRSMKKEQLEQLDPRKALKDIPLLIKTGTVFTLVMIGFFVHSVFQLEAATIAMAGAALLLLLTIKHPDDIYKEVEWGTILFFTGLFVMVGAMEHVGIIEVIASQVMNLTGGDALKTSMLVLWFSGLSSGVIDNIPITTVLVTMIKDIQATGVDVNTLWWSLSLGACLGGNATLIGASANVVGADICNRTEYKITFFDFLKYGLFISLLGFVIASGYIYLRYFVFQF
ncbi:MAG: ArsB/NhaD family transporter [Patescibacteria group bacterium]|nr:ArsB/NhaD family transporter [Patescibacteria group bacterium]